MRLSVLGSVLGYKSDSHKHTGRGGRSSRRRRGGGKTSSVGERRERFERVELSPSSFFDGAKACWCLLVLFLLLSSSRSGFEIGSVEVLEAAESEREWVVFDGVPDSFAFNDELSFLFFVLYSTPSCLLTLVSCSYLSFHSTLEPSSPRLVVGQPFSSSSPRIKKVSRADSSSFFRIIFSPSRLHPVLKVRSSF